jgi:hypothetical protein
MRIVPAVDAEIRREIRDARAVDPLISFAALEERLEKKLHRGFSYKYVAKLAGKVARQALVEADRTKIEERLAFTRENYRFCARTVDENRELEIRRRGKRTAGLAKPPRQSW